MPPDRYFEFKGQPDTFLLGETVLNTTYSSLVVSYINTGQQDAILCPYCGTRFRFDPRLGPSEADPPDSLFVDPDPG